MFVCVPIERDQRSTAQNCPEHPEASREAKCPEIFRKGDILTDISYLSHNMGFKYFYMLGLECLHYVKCNFLYYIYIILPSFPGHPGGRKRAERTTGVAADHHHAHQRVRPSQHPPGGRARGHTPRQGTQGCGREGGASGELPVQQPLHLRQRVLHRAHRRRRHRRPVHPRYGQRSVPQQTHT